MVEVDPAIASLSAIPEDSAIVSAAADSEIPDG